jgi:hypothetical protein
MTDVAADKRIVRVGKLTAQPDDLDRPYYVTIEMFEGASHVVQPMSEDDLLGLFNRVIEKHKPTIVVKLI